MFRQQYELPYDGVICGLCKGPPKAPYGILGWTFDQNLISCLECRKVQPQEQTKPPSEGEEFNKKSLWQKLGFK